MGNALPAWLTLGLAPLALAQELRWRLPPLGAAEYERTIRAHGAVAETAVAARALVPRDRVPERLLSPLLPAPWLCQRELDADQQRIADPVRDLRDVVRAVAFDLGAGGSGRWRFARIVPFGDLLVAGRVGPLGQDGAQDLQLTVARRPAAVQTGESAAACARFIAPLCAFDVDGALRLRRLIDVGNGLVREFTAELELVVAEDRKRHHKIVLRDHWRLVAVREHQDDDFRARVAAAVRGGAGWLRATLAAGPAYFDDQEADRSFGSGRLALAALTLLHAEVPAGDPLLQTVFATLRKRKLIDTYSLGVALMAMAQRYAPPREAELVRNGQLAARARRQLDAQDRRAAERWLARLLDNRDRRVDPATCTRFCYVEGARWDNSLTQYGLLGLDAAELCGLEVPPAVWTAAANGLLAAQAPAGQRVGLQLLSHRELAAAAGGPPPRAEVVTAPARGFAYREPDEPAYGGLTAAGVAGLVLARAGMLRADLGTPASRRALDDGIAAGFAFLAREFTVRANPGFVGKADRHWYYWLYGLERVCELTGTARIQSRDWYHEGALQLLAQQQPNGSFRGEGDGLLLDSTCFAVLFLKKSTLPAVTTSR